MYNSLVVVMILRSRLNEDKQDVAVQFLIVHRVIVERDMSQFSCTTELMEKSRPLWYCNGDIKVDCPGMRVITGERQPTTNQPYEEKDLLYFS